MLKLNRYTQWIQALKRANLSLRQWLTLLTIPFTERRATRRTWRRRMSQCLRCPIYNREHKTCMLCECYMPIKASFAKQRCAGEIDGVSSARGWDNKSAVVKWDRGATPSSLDMLTEAAIARGVDGAQNAQCLPRRGSDPRLKATEASGSLIFADWSDLESPITEAMREAAFARGRAAGIIINDQQKENDE